MYIVPQYEPKIRLISQNQEEVVYDNYKEFLKNTSLYFLREHVVTTFRDYPIGTNGRQYYFLADRRDLDLYIVRDEFGSVFSAGEVVKDKKEKSDFCKRLRLRRFGVEHDHHVYRTNPVPGTGKRKWKFKNFYKTPQTAQEKRWAIAHKNYVREKRKKHVLPDAWDDYPRADFSIKRSWKKRKKRKQWM